MITWQLIAKDLQNFISRSLGGCFEVRVFPTSWKGDLSCPWWLMMWHVESDQTDSSVPTVSKIHVSTTFRSILEERWRFAALLHVKFRFDKSGIPFSRDTSLRLGPEIWRWWHGLTIKDTKCTIPVPSQSKLAGVTISSAIVSVECMNDSIDISDPPTSNKTKCKKRNCCVLYIPSQPSVIITCNRWSINIVALWNCLLTSYLLKLNSTVARQSWRSCISRGRWNAYWTGRRLMGPWNELNAKGKK